MPGQLIPPPVTEPVPAPETETFSTGAGCWEANVAVTVWSELMVTVHVAVAPQPPPDQPAKVDPVAGVAVNVTVVPGG